MKTRIVLALALCTVQGCAAFIGDDARALADNDHTACDARGHEWPSAGYERCRYEIAERRHRRDWQNLRMIEPQRPDQGARPAPEPYRSLPRGSFRCVERTLADGGRWIECGP